MYICNCHGVREQEIASSIDAGHTTLRALRETLGVGTCCGKCVCDVQRQLHDTLAGKSGAARQGCPGHCAAAAAGHADPGHAPRMNKRISTRLQPHSMGVVESSLC